MLETIIIIVGILIISRQEAKRNMREYKRYRDDRPVKLRRVK